MDIKLIKKFLDLPGVPGHEEIITKEYKKEISKIGFSYVRDELGSIFALKKSKIKDAKKVMVDSHCDEVGFIVTEITKKGLIKVIDVGGFIPMTLLTNRINIWINEEKKISGTFLSPSPHLYKAKNNKKIEIEKDLFIDIGAKNKEDVLKQGIKFGNQITFDVEAKELLNNRMMSKAADNRMGLVATLEILNKIKNIDLPYDLYVGTSVQEEEGLRGARTITKKINPDFSIVIDVSPAQDTEEKGVHGKLGAGTIIRYIDGYTITNPKIIDWQRKISKKYNIKTQDFISPGGTNAGIIHISNEGIFTAQNGIVARSLHSQSTVFDLNDYDEMVKFVIAELKELDEETIKGFNFDK